MCSRSESKFFPKICSLHWLPVNHTAWTDKITFIQPYLKLSLNQRPAETDIQPPVVSEVFPFKNQVQGAMENQGVECFLKCNCLSVHSHLGVREYMRVSSGGLLRYYPPLPYYQLWPHFFVRSSEFEVNCGIFISLRFDSVIWQGFNMIFEKFNFRSKCEWTVLIMYKVFKRSLN